jgi:hypothetical protein
MINSFKFNKEIKMKNKLSILVSVLAILVVILGVTAFLAYSRSAENPQPIPVTGRSNNGLESAEQIQAQQGLQALKDQPAQSARIIANSQWVPGQEYMQGQPAPAIETNVKSRWVPGQEYILGQPAQAARTSANSQWVPGQEFMLGQPAPAINTNGTNKADPSWDHISGQSALPVNDLNKSYSTRGYIRFQSSGGQ